MAFGKIALTLTALISTAALVSASACTVTEGEGTGGTGTTSTGGTGGTGGSTAATGGSGGDGDGGSVPADCQTYCEDNIANCTGDNKQWDTTDPTPQATCEAQCSLWDQGAVGAVDGDSLECRAYHTGAAATDADTHCSHAGPFGNQACGASQCATFCAAMQLVCTGSDAEYATEGECITDCETASDKDTAYNADSTNMADQFACRGYHLSAALDNPGLHCEHAAGVDACP